MRAAAGLGAALCALLVARPVLAAEMIIVEPVAQPTFGWTMPRSPFENMRLGMAGMQNEAVTKLFSGPGVSLGLDVPLGNGLAIGIDSTTLHQSFPGASYWLSLNPVLVKYRLALAEGGVRPYLSVGGGLAGMGLVGDGDAPRFGVGFSGGTGLGLAFGDALALEAGVQAGQVSQIPYWGWQLKLGTGFGTLASWARPAAPAPAVRAVVPRPAAPTAHDLLGSVLEADNGRLVIGYDRALTAGVGDELLVYYEDGIVVKVARARVESLTPDGRAVARVLDSTEPIKKGYRVRGW